MRTDGIDTKSFYVPRYIGTTKFKGLIILRFGSKDIKPIPNPYLSTE